MKSDFLRISVDCLPKHVFVLIAFLHRHAFFYGMAVTLQEGLQSPLPPGIHAFVLSPPTLNRGAILCKQKDIAEVTVWLPMLGQKRPCDFHLALLDYLLWGEPASRL